DDPHQGGLAAARGTDEGDEFAPPDAEIDIGEGDDRGIRRGEDEGEPANLDRRGVGDLGLVRDDLEAGLGHSARFGLPALLFRHSRESGNPGPSSRWLPWIPAFAGMT